MVPRTTSWLKQSRQLQQTSPILCSQQQLKQQQVDIARTLVQEAEVLLGDLKASFFEVSFTLSLPMMQTNAFPTAPLLVVT